MLANSFKFSSNPNIVTLALIIMTVLFTSTHPFPSWFINNEYDAKQNDKEWEDGVNNQKSKIAQIIKNRR